MSKVIKRVARIALPIVGSIVGGPIGAAVGGAVGGALGGGGIKGALLGGISGYASAGLGSSILGTAAGTPIAGVTGNAALQGPSLGSGVLGAVTGGGARALTAGIQAIPQQLSSPSSLLLGVGNQLVAEDQAEAAEKAARLQVEGAERAIATQRADTAPYRQLGAESAQRIQEIQADPAAYIQNNPLYNSLAKDAEQRLLANQAAKGKVGSGGTAAALQDQLLQIGNGLVNQEINNLQTQTSIGGNAAVGAANNISNLQVEQGNAQASGVIGAENAYSSGYQNQINTLLAMQNLNRTPVYEPPTQLNL